VVPASACPSGGNTRRAIFLTLPSPTRFQLRTPNRLTVPPKREVSVRSTALPFPWLTRSVDVAADGRSINPGHSSTISSVCTTRQLRRLACVLVAPSCSPIRDVSPMSDRSTATPGARVSERKERGALATTAPGRVTSALPFADCVGHRDGSPRSGPVCVAGRRK
jgi:hypothetical protein